MLNKNINIHDICSTGWTPLHIASYNNNKRMINILIEKGANLLQYDNENITPLDIILSYHDFDSIKFTLDNVDRALFVNTFINPIQFYIRVEDNENLKLEEQEDIKCIIDSKFG